MNKEIKLSVNDLKVSFRTDAGKVQAVRNISFDLYKGETLAIVGESGSGKSVTSKAIMGISAVNSIYEGGEILYDGQDLTRIPEEEMHKLRGDKIAMIFQDPLSSLNPIMRIGRQITEAMLLKNKANRKEGRVTFNKTLAELSGMIKKTLAETADTSVSVSDVDKYIKYKNICNKEAAMLQELFTTRGTQVGETPWQVYPRPQMRRESYVNLNGTWELSVKEEKYDIRVPFCPESLLSGVQKHFPEGSHLVYRRQFTLPENFNKGRVRLHVGAADQTTACFVNGGYVGETCTGYISTTFDITPFLRSGENELTLSCQDDLTNQSMP